LAAIREALRRLAADNDEVRRRMRAPLGLAGDDPVGCKKSIR
jgi:hypothetical protein